MSSEFEMSENSHTETGVKHGQFYVYLNTDGKNVKQLVNPLTQEDIADDWRTVLPKSRKNSTIHHFSVYLSQLPPHLWRKVNVDNKKNDTYQEISDCIYKYSVKMSKYDCDIRRLHSLIMARSPKIEQISEQFKILQNARVKGWVMIKAHYILHPTSKKQ